MHSFLMLEKGLQNTDLYWKKVELICYKGKFLVFFSKLVKVYLVCL